MNDHTKKQALGIAAAFGAVLIWSGAYSGKELLLRYVTPVELVFLQYLLAMPVTLLLAVLRRENLRLPPGKLASVGLSGILGIAFFQVALNIGISLVGSSVAAIFSGLLPSCALAVEIIIQKRCPNKGQLLSILASTIGIVLVTGFAGKNTFSVWGYLLLLASNFLWVAFCYFNKQLQEKQAISGTVLVLYQSLSTSLFLTPVVWGGMHQMIQAVLCPDSLAALLFLVVGNAVLAYVLLNFALMQLDVVFCNIIFNFVPVVTVILNRLLYGQRTAFAQSIGTALIILSVFISTAGNDKRCWKKKSRK